MGGYNDSVNATHGAGEALGGDGARAGAAHEQLAERWQLELGSYFDELWHGEHAAAMLGQLPHRNLGSGRFLPHLTARHVRMLQRLLVSRHEELHDISAGEAAALFGARGRLGVSFQGTGSVAPEGWLQDLGEAFGARGNGHAYGWKCGAGGAAPGGGGANRNRSAYTWLENTLVAADRYSRCERQEWQIRLPAGRYRVEVTIQDPQHRARASGCALQGRSLGFPAVVEPSGARAARDLVVDVADFLSFSGGGGNCSSVNRITVQEIGAGAAGAAGPQARRTQCRPVREWCPALAPPPHSHVSPASRMASAQPLGSRIELSCDASYAPAYGIRHLFCGTDVFGRSGQWRALDSGHGQPLLQCREQRAWCPELAPTDNSVLVLLGPPSYGIGAEANFACSRGFVASSGASKLRCMPSRDWCSVLASGDCVLPAAQLRCEPAPQYCPELTSGPDGPPAPDFPAPNLPPRRDPTTVRSILPIAAGLLGEERHIACPPHYHRVHGDARIVCTHGAMNSGTWQRMSDAAHLMDDVPARPLVCELDAAYGVRRRVHTNAHAMHEGAGATHTDVIPNIDQFASDYEAAQFEAHLNPASAGLYTFAVEVVGAFLLSFQGRVVLTGRSSGMEPELFTTGALPCASTGFYALGLQYTFDPVFPPAPGQEGLPRRVRLLWSSAGSPFQPVPPAVLRHGFRSVHGFPRAVAPINDPASCAPGSVAAIFDLRIGDRGSLADGSPDRDHNQDLRCRWWVRATETVRLNFFVNSFDLENTSNCEADRLQFLAGNDEFLASFCGSYGEGQLLVSLRVSELFIEFITDSKIEKAGFNISYVVADEFSDPPE